LKRVQAVLLEPAPNGLTVIGGKNGQGKTSILDAIAWALGGGKFAPTNPQHEGAMNPPTIEVTLDNGIVVRRDGTSATLKVTDPTGAKAGQSLLDSFVSTFALDLPRFLSASSRDKCLVLLKTLGIGEKLDALDRDEDTLYNKRTAIGQIADSKEKYAKELPEYPDAPEATVSISFLLSSQQEVLANNEENKRKRARLDDLKGAVRLAEQQRGVLAERIQALMAERDALDGDLLRLAEDVRIAETATAALQDQSTAELEAQIANFEAINAQVAANMAKAAALDEAAAQRSLYQSLTETIEQLRRDRLELLNNAGLPLPGLTVEKGDLLYNGMAWDCMSGSEQLRVAVAIVRRLNPECGFVLLDKLEQMDADTLREFGEWLEAEGLQAIATRVSTGEECTLVIEDGLPAGQSYADVVAGLAPAGTNNKKEW
jgi:hypothetical protein